MKQYFFTLLLLWAIMPSHGQNLPDSPKPAGLIGTEAPDFILKDVYGKDVKLSSFKGKAVLINFFSNIYVNCQQEYPLLQEIVDEYENKNIVFLNIAITDSITELMAFGKNYDKNGQPFFSSHKDYKNESNEYKAYFAKGRFDLKPRNPNHYLLHRGKEIESGIPAPEIDPDGFYGSPFNPKDGYKRAEAFEVAKLYQTTDYPTKFLIGKDGKIRYVKTDFDFDKRAAIKQKYIEEINKLLAEQ